VHGPLREVIICHCGECRRWHGQPAAFTAAARGQLRMLADAELRWTGSPASASHARRGFCGACGSSLFWDAPAAEVISIAAGCLDPGPELRAVAHIYVADAAHPYELPEDGLPRYPGSRPHGERAGA
jgi:hypothetical protein